MGMVASDSVIQDVVDVEAAVPALEPVKVIVHKDAGHLAGAVGAEVDEHHRIALGHAAALAGDAGHHELVGDAVGVAALDAFLPVGGVVALAVDKGGIGLLLTVPVLVAVHGVIATADRRDGADAQRIQLVLDALQEVLAVVGGSVSRPSMMAWTYTSLAPRALAISSRPNRWSSWLWTPPVPIRPIKWMALPWSMAAFHVAHQHLIFSASRRPGWTW